MLGRTGHWASRLVAAATLQLAACGNAPKPAIDPAEEARAVLAVDRRMQTAIDQKDLAAVGDLFTADGRAMGPGFAPMVGRAAIRQGFGEMMKDPKMDLKWTPETPRVAAGGDLAYETGTYRLTMTGPDGRPVQDHGTFVTVFRHVNGLWLYDRDIASSELPPAAPAVTPQPKR